MTGGPAEPTDGRPAHTHDRLKALGPPIHGLTVSIPHDLAHEIVFMLDELDSRQDLDDDVLLVQGPDGVNECGTCGTQLALIAHIEQAVAANRAARDLDET